MVTNIFDNCERVRELMEFHHNQKSESFEIAGHLKTCAKCAEIWTESLSLKRIVKRAVEKDFAPQRLIDSIKMQIRR